MFDWDRFKKGKIKVILRTEQLAKDFYKECKKRRIDWSRCDYAIWNEGGIVYKYCTISNSLVWNGIIDDGQESVEWKGVNCMKELTFKEVIANIKENEVWESDIKIIKCTNDGNISVRSKIDGKTEIMNFNKCNLYKLQREEYTFEEAFKKLKVGKEIESVITKEKYRIIESEFRFPKGDPGKNIVISYREIEGKWYIND